MAKSHPGDSVTKSTVWELESEPQICLAVKWPSLSSGGDNFHEVHLFVDGGELHIFRRFLDISRLPVGPTGAAATCGPVFFLGGGGSWSRGGVARFYKSGEKGLVREGEEVEVTVEMFSGLLERGGVVE